MDYRSLRKILIVKISSLGDIIHSFPAIELLKKYCPQSQIDWLVHPAFKEAVEYCPHVSKTIIFPRQQLAEITRFPFAAASLIGALRQKRYDIVIDMQGLIRSAFFSWTANSPLVAGFATPKEKPAALFYSKKIDVDMGMHAVKKNISLVAGLLEVPFEIPDISIPVNEKNSASAKSKLAKASLAEAEKYVCIAPGARWRSKQWPPDFFAKIAEQILLKMPEMRFVIIGAKSEILPSKIIEDILPEHASINLCGLTSMGELFEVLRNSSLLLANDSGPLHIASALNIPSLAIFGPTDPDKTGPFGKLHSIFQPEMPCIKCMSDYCYKGGYPCHSGIDPLAVATCAIEKLSNSNRG